MQKDKTAVAERKMARYETEKQVAHKEKDSPLSRLCFLVPLAGICCFLWGSATPAIKIGYQMFHVDTSDTVSILLFAGIRFFLAGFLVILFRALADKKWTLPPKGAGRALLTLALCQTVLQYFFFYIGLANASGVHGAILTGTGVFFSMLVAALLFHYERLNARKLLGCALGFAGIIIINLTGNATTGLFHFSILGEGFVLAAQFFYALSAAFMKKFGKQFDVVILSGYQFMLGGILLAVIGFIGGGRIGIGASKGAYALLLYLGCISAVAYTLWGVLLKYNPVSRVSIFGFMNPVFGVLLSALFLGESGQAFSGQALAALILVCFGIFVVNRAPENRKMYAAAAEARR